MADCRCSNWERGFCMCRSVCDRSCGDLARLAWRRPEESSNLRARPANCRCGLRGRSNDVAALIADRNEDVVGGTLAVDEPQITANKSRADKLAAMGADGAAFVAFVEGCNAHGCLRAPPRNHRSSVAPCRLRLRGFISDVVAVSGRKLPHIAKGQRKGKNDAACSVKAPCVPRTKLLSATCLGACLEAAVAKHQCSYTADSPLLQNNFYLENSATRRLISTFTLTDVAQIECRRSVINAP